MYRILLLLCLFSGALFSARASKLLLTIDDGPNKTSMAMAKYLNAYGIKAIWFVIGDKRNLQYNSNVISYLLSTGHQLGNHTVSHDYKHMRSCDDSKAFNDMNPINQYLKSQYNYDVQYVRYPYGDVANFYLAATHDMGMIPLPWNLCFDDYKYPQGIPISQISNDLLGNHMFREVNILLLHSNGRTLNSLPDILLVMRLNGLSFIDPKTFSYEYGK